ncbi:hypothetical protein Kuja_0850 [Vibrio phage vB_VchM_Kuja]|uniref:Uncharacterized protein n=1 Tax=Vibrio phage vB_VchM_Kuja TaxID=2686437 RepID=A0A6B9JAT9_9CAUD|nr:hypothetical protein HWC83_gp151 [Vibrio phage vB_VchM_Kuja]QGZ16076.1 hypothetical protein Kuja_0850 [Vibrio phage vB_VchM_Kuja]
MKTHLLKGTGCKVRNESEYGIAVGIYLAAGCSIWPWHKGWQGLPEGEDHIVISWEPRGIMAQAGCPKQVFENIMELIYEFQRKVDTMCVIRVYLHDDKILYLARGVGKNEPFMLTSVYSEAWQMDRTCAEQTMKSLEEYSKKRDLYRDLTVVPLMWVEEYGY